MSVNGAENFKNGMNDVGIGNPGGATNASTGQIGYNAFGGGAVAHTGDPAAVNGVNPMADQNLAGRNAFNGQSNPGTVGAASSGGSVIANNPGTEGNMPEGSLPGTAGEPNSAVGANWSADDFFGDEFLQSPCLITLSPKFKEVFKAFLVRKKAGDAIDVGTALSQAIKECKILTESDEHKAANQEMRFLIRAALSLEYLDVSWANEESFIEYAWDKRSVMEILVTELLYVLEKAAEKERIRKANEAEHDGMANKDEYVRTLINLQPVTELVLALYRDVTLSADIEKIWQAHPVHLKEDIEFLRFCGRFLSDGHCGTAPAVQLSSRIVQELGEVAKSNLSECSGGILKGAEFRREFEEFLMHADRIQDLNLMYELLAYLSDNLPKGTMYISAKNLCKVIQAFKNLRQEPYVTVRRHLIAYDYLELEMIAKDDKVIDFYCWLNTLVGIYGKEDSKMQELLSQFRDVIMPEGR